MQRIQAPVRETLPEQSKKIWDVIDKTRGGVWGPYAVLMHSPALCEKVASLGEQLRFHGVLPDLERELAILTAARESRCQFEWVIHEPIARRACASDQIIESILSGKIGEEIAGRRIYLISKIISDLFRTHKLDDNFFEEAKAELGIEALIEVMVIAGFYRLLAFVIQGFEVENPETELSLPDF